MVLKYLILQVDLKIVLQEKKVERKKTADLINAVKNSYLTLVIYLKNQY